MPENSLTEPPFVTDKQYAKLVQKAVRLIKQDGLDPYRAELRIRVRALHHIPAHTPDRREHAYDLAMQATFDAAAELGIEVE